MINVSNIIACVTCMAKFLRPNGPITYSVDFYTVNLLFLRGLHLHVAVSLNVK